MFIFIFFCFFCSLLFGNVDDKLLDACIKGDYNRAISAIEEGANINIKKDRKFTPLMFASESGNLELVKELVLYGGKVDESCKLIDKETGQYFKYYSTNGYNPNYYSRYFDDIVIEFNSGIFAINYNKLEVLDFLIDNSSRRSQMHYFLYSAHVGNNDAYHILTNKTKGIININSFRTKMLITALENEQIDFANNLINFNKNKGSLSEYLFYCVAIKGHFNIIKDLVEKGANVNYVYNSDNWYSNSVLLNSIEMGDSETVKYLIDKGANINFTRRDYSIENYTTLLAAMSKNNVEMIKHLISAGYDINTKIKVNSQTDFDNALIYAFYLLKSNSKHHLNLDFTSISSEVVEELLKSGATTKSDKVDLIEIAVKLKRFDLVKVLKKYI